MLRYEAYMLVDLVPPFLKTFGSGHNARDRRLSEETTPIRLEISKLESLTRGLNALQVHKYSVKCFCIFSHGHLRVMWAPQ